MPDGNAATSFFRRLVLASLMALVGHGCSPPPEEFGRDGNLKLHLRVANRYNGALHLPTLDPLAETVLDRLAPGVGRLNGEAAVPRDRWKVTVLDTPGLQSFTGPDLGFLFPRGIGARIYLSRGLLAFPDNEAEFAALLAHEMAHAIAPHDAGSHWLAVLPQLVLDAADDDPKQDPSYESPLWWPPNRFNIDAYGPDQEEEADMRAAQLLADAGYPPSALLSLTEKLRRWGDYQRENNPSLRQQEEAADPTLRYRFADKPRWDNASQRQRLRRIDANDRWSMLDRHPVDDERLAGIRNVVARYLSPAAAAGLTLSPFLAAVDGLPWGDVPGTGHLLGRHVIFPAGEDGQTGFRFSVPPGFHLFAGNRRVGAVHPGIGATILFDLAGNPQHLTARQYLKDTWTAAARLETTGRSVKVSIPGADGAAVAATVSTPQGSLDLLLIAVPLDDGRMARFIGVAPSGQADTVEQAFLAVAASFRRLSSTHPSHETAEHLTILQVQPGETVARLAAGMGRYPDAARFFRILNGLNDDQEPAAGQWVKVIVAE